VLAFGLDTIILSTNRPLHKIELVPQVLRDAELLKAEILQIRHHLNQKQQAETVAPT
jgi:hypothetical protein